MNRLLRGLLACGCGLVLVASPLLAEDLPLSNWTAPATWAPATDAGDSKSNTREALAIPARPLPFNALAPCRLADTRDSAFPVGYGPPLLSAGVTRDILFVGRCGIPASAVAVSVSVIATQTAGPGFITAFPAGDPPPNPMVSIVNYMGSGATVANAAVVSLGSSGAATFIAGVSSSDLVIDVNGYYGGTVVSTVNGLYGDLNLVPGSNVSISSNGNDLTIASSVPQGPAGPTGATGATGATGPAGPTGASGISSPLVFGPYASGSPDSGICGNNWANDTFTRTYIVTPRTDSSFDVTELFLGTFVTLAGESPGNCSVTIPAGITGQMWGNFAFTVPAQADFNFTATCPTGCGSVDFLNAYFGINPVTHLPWTGIPGTYAWQFHYLASNGSSWNNTDHGNTGNITP